MKKLFIILICAATVCAAACGHPDTSNVPAGKDSLTTVGPPASGTQTDTSATGVDTTKKPQ